MEFYKGKELTVLFYDEYFDIPKRGVVNVGEGLRAFTAEVNEGASDSEWEKGIPALMNLSDASRELISDYELTTKVFLKWSNGTRQAPHPLNADPMYIDAIGRIATQFEAMRETACKKYAGLFRNDGHYWRFRLAGNI